MPLLLQLGLHTRRTFRAVAAITAAGRPPHSITPAALSSAFRISGGQT
jgi:hypothetical protein